MAEILPCFHAVILMLLFSMTYSGKSQQAQLSWVLLGNKLFSASESAFSLSFPSSLVGEPNHMEVHNLPAVLFVVPPSGDNMLQPVLTTPGAKFNRKDE